MIELRKKLLQLYSSCATVGPIGFLPAPGTFGTLITLPCIYLYSWCKNYFDLSFTSNVLIQIMILIVLIAIAYSSITLYVAYYYNAQDKNTLDPQEIIIDEVIGTWVTFIGVSITPMSLLAGFLLFRFFDITKWFGIKKLENIPGVWGIILDDIAAGIMSLLVVALYTIIT